MGGFSRYKRPNVSVMFTGVVIIQQATQTMKLAALLGFFATHHNRFLFKVPTHPDGVSNNMVYISWRCMSSSRQQTPLKFQHLRTYLCRFPISFASYPAHLAIIYFALFYFPWPNSLSLNL